MVKCSGKHIKFEFYNFTSMRSKGGKKKKSEILFQITFLQITFLLWTPVSLIYLLSLGYGSSFYSKLFPQPMMHTHYMLLPYLAKLNIDHYAIS